MELLAFGDHGFPVVVFPTSGGRFWEYEERGMVNTLRRKMDAGQLQLFCVDTVDKESWYNWHARPEDRLHRQNAWDAYLVQEFTPFVRNRTTWDRMGATGCSLGGYHSMNFALRHPDIVTYVVSMSGAFDIPRRFLQGFYNNDAYFNSPIDYLPSLEDHWFLDRIRKNYYVLATGNRDPLFEQSVLLANQLGSRQIPHVLDVWQGFGHDWPWWHQMAHKFFIG